MRTVGETTCEVVSGVNLIVRNAKKVAPTRAKLALSKTLKLL